MQRYLKSADLKLGILINFNEYKLKPKRILNSSSELKTNINFIQNMTNDPFQDIIFKVDANY